MHYILPNWHSTAEGEKTLSALVDKKTNRRRHFSLLERPTFGSVIPKVFEYKIFVCGKSGAGKTSVVAKLSANKVSLNHFETAGMQVSTVYWPVKLIDVDNIVLFKLQLWDAGDNILNRFDYMLPACTDKVDGIIFTFSFVDKSSFNDLPHRITQTSADEGCRFVIGTKLDLQNRVEVTLQEVRDFELNWSVKVLPVCPVASSPNGEASMDEWDSIAPVLNHICGHLWHRDQVLAKRSAPPRPS